MKQASPAATPSAPTERPEKTVPSSRTSAALHSSHNICIIRILQRIATSILGASGYQEVLDRVLAHPALDLVALGLSRASRRASSTHA